MSCFSADADQEIILHHEISGKPWDITGADIFFLYSKHYLGILDYHSKFRVIQKTESLILASKVIFAEYGLPNKMSDAMVFFVSEKLKEFCRNLTIQVGVSSSNHHQTNEQTEVSIKFVKQTLKKCFNTNAIYF